MSGGVSGQRGEIIRELGIFELGDFVCCANIFLRSIITRLNKFVNFWLCSVNDYSKIETRERIVAGNWKGHVRNGPARNTVQFPSTKYREYHEKREYPRFDKVRSNSDVVFPSERELSIEPSTNSLQNDFLNSESDVWRKENIEFFPKVIV